MQRFLVVIGTCAACGGGSHKTPDAAVNPDAPTADVAIDAPPAVPLLHLAVADLQNTISVFALTDSGDVAPARKIVGSGTNLNAPNGLAYTGASGELAIVNGNAATLDFYPVLAIFNQAPLREVTDATSTWMNAIGATYDPVTDAVFTCNAPGGKVGGGQGAVVVFPRTANGAVTPTRVITGATTGIVACEAVIVDHAHSELIVSDAGSSSIRVFAIDATGDVAPLRTIAGATTTLSGPYGIALDAVHDELIVVDENLGNIDVFPRTASGDVAPTRSVSGATATLGDARAIVYEPKQDELWITEIASNPGVLVFDRTATGNVAPKRILAGTMTGLMSPDALTLVP